MRADGAVDEEIAGRSAGSEVPDRLLPVELPPVADDLGHVRLATEGQRIEEVLGTADRRAGILVHARDATCCRCAQRRALSNCTLLGIDRTQCGLAQRVMGRTRDRAIRRPSVRA